MKLLKYKQERRWFLIDATSLVLGRLCCRISNILIGKLNSCYNPCLDFGDYVVITNSDKLVVTGDKFNSKMYYKYSGYPSGLKKIAFCKLFENNSEKIILNAVKGMLPKNKLGRRMFLRLKVYKSDTHPHVAQKLTKIRV